MKRGGENVVSNNCRNMFLYDRYSCDICILLYSGKRQKKKEVDTPQKSKSVVLYESDYKFPKRQIKWLFHIYAGWIRYKLIHLGKIPCHTYRNFMLRHVYRMKLAKTAVIYGGFEIRSPWNIHIADGAIVGDESKLDGRNGIFIGKMLI